MSTTNFPAGVPATPAAKSKEELLKKDQATIEKELHMARMHDPDLPIGTRISEAAQAVGSKASEEYHSLSEKWNQPIDTPGLSRIGLSDANQENTLGSGVQPALRAVDEHLKRQSALEEKEHHKALMNDPNLPYTTRINEAVHAVGSAASESYHALAEEWNKPNIPTPPITADARAAEEALLRREALDEKELHKARMHDPNLPVTTRANEAAHAVGSGLREEYHTLAEQWNKSAHPGLYGTELPVVDAPSLAVPSQPRYGTSAPAPTTSSVRSAEEAMKRHEAITEKELQYVMLHNYVNTTTL
jgi:putative sterol carrier protein